MWTKHVFAIEGKGLLLASLVYHPLVEIFSSTNFVFVMIGCFGDVLVIYETRGHRSRASVPNWNVMILTNVLKELHSATRFRRM